jgi:hypothetical protein
MGCVAMVTVFSFVLINPVLWGNVVGEIRLILDRWDEIIGFQMEKYSRMALPTLSMKTGAVWDEAVLSSGPFSPGVSRWLVPILFGAGLLILAFRGWQALRIRERTVHAWVFLVWVVLWIVSTVLWIPMDWERYYLPAVVPVVLLAMLPLAELGNVGLSRGKLLLARNGRSKVEASSSNSSS